MGTAVILIGLAEAAAGEPQDVEGRLDDDGVGEVVKRLEEGEPLEVLGAALLHNLYTGPGAG